MVLSIIAAMAENRVIGYKNAMPWHIPSDRRRFRKMTWGHPVVFGRKTFEGIGHPLPGRTNIVLTRNRNYTAEGITIVHSLEEAFNACADSDEAFICGGGMVFEETMAFADRIYLSHIHKVYEGDTFLAEIPASFSEISREEIEEAIPYSFIIFGRERNPAAK